MNMRPVLVSLLLGLLSALLACAQEKDDMKKSTSLTPKITREYLLAHGYKEMANNPGDFSREHVRLGDVLRELDIPIASLRPTLNPERANERMTAEDSEMYAIFRSEPRQNEGRIVRDQLDDPDAICAVRVSLNKPPPLREYAKTDSIPHLRIKSVEMPKDTAKPWQITFELDATGKKPVAIRQGDFLVRVTRKASPSLDIRTHLRFPEKTPKPISVLPDKPMKFVVEVPPGVIPEELRSPGEYALQIVISAGKRQHQTLDYEWKGGGYSSDKYKYIIK